MHELTYEDLPKLKISTRVIVNELLDRGLRVQGFVSTSGLLQVDLPDSTVPMRLFSVIDESMSFIAGRAIAGNKQVTNAIVKSIGINVPDELYINPTILHEDPDTVDAFIKSHGKVVAKPIDGAHGKAVYINLDSLQQVMDCAQAILQESRFDGFLVQQQLTGFDVRVVCIDGVYASAMTRVPATVIGDGVHTVEQLIDIENGQSDRGGDDYNTLYNKIDMKYVRQYLPQEDMISIPSVGRNVQVIGIANVGVGGTRKNLDNDLPQFMTAQAEAISRELRLPVCGVDFFVNTIPRADMQLDDLNPTVIEVNHCPGLTMYESLDDPRQRQIAKKLVDVQIAAHQKLYPATV